MGPGKADLLEAIARTGSISAASRDLGMSYRRGWMLVDVMNRCFCEKLVETRPGGGKAAGARLTRAGEQALSAYRSLAEEIGERASSPSFERLQQALRQKPLSGAEQS